MKKKKITGTLSSVDYYNSMMDNEIKNYFGIPYNELSWIVQKNIDDVGRKLIQALKPVYIYIQKQTDFSMMYILFIGDDKSVKVISDWETFTNNVFFSVYSHKELLYMDYKPVNEVIEGLSKVLSGVIYKNKYMSLNELKDYCSKFKKPYHVKYLIHDCLHNDENDMSKVKFVIDRLPDFKYQKINDELIVGEDNGIYKTFYRNKSENLITDKDSFSLPGKDGSTIICDNSWHWGENDASHQALPELVFFTAFVSDITLKKDEKTDSFFFLDKRLYQYMLNSFEGDIYSVEEIEQEHRGHFIF